MYVDPGAQRLIDRLTERVEALEASLQTVLDHLRSESPGALEDAGELPELGRSDEVLDLLRSGHKIAAIDAYKKANGCRLKEAKQAVEQLQAQHGL